MPTLNDYATACHDQAIASGFWPEHEGAADALPVSSRPRPFSEVCMLLCEEASELFRAYRNGAPMQETTWKVKAVPLNMVGINGLELNLGGLGAGIHFRTLDGRTGWTKAEFPRDLAMFREHGYEVNPEGIPTELADVLIRAFDIAGAYGIDLDVAVQAKMDANGLRTYRHGDLRA